MQAIVFGKGSIFIRLLGGTTGGDSDNPMKSIFACSIILNLAMAVLLASRIKTSPEAAKASPPTTKVFTNTVVKKFKQTTPDGPVTKLVQINWSTVESADFKEYIKNLRAIGCPEETVRDIIIADVNKLFAARRIAMFSPEKELNYWEPDDQNDMWRNRKFQKQNQMMEREKRDLIRELLDIDLNKEMQKFYGYGQSDRTGKMLSFLPQEKSAAVKTLREKYQTLISKVYEDADDNGSVETQTQIKNIRAQQKTELAQLLSPEEMRQYDLRLSDTAQSLRHGLLGFEPSEQEFASLFGIRERFDGTMQDIPYDPDDEAGNKKRSEIYKQMENKIKSSMTPERYAEYKRGNDYEYRELLNFTKGLDLPKAAADQTYDIKKSAEEAVQKVRSDKNLTAEQRKETLKLLRDETEKTLTEVMGEKGLKGYKRERGWWIRSLGN